MSAFKGLPPTPNLIYAPDRLVITGTYFNMTDEKHVKRLIRDWRAGTGVDASVQENFVKRWLRQLRGKPVPTRGLIHCQVEMDKDQMVYTARFHK